MRPYRGARIPRDFYPFILGGGLTVTLVGYAFLFGHPLKTRTRTWCDNIQIANGCPGPARLESLPHGAFECHCDAWEKAK
jgi:hypothetical protein